MFSFFKSNSDPASTAGGGYSNFDIGPECSLGIHGEKHIFRMYEGTYKKDQRPITVFLCDGGPTVEAAAAAAKKLKTLKHPSVLTFVDAVITDTSVVVVTEPVKPLSMHLEELDALGVRGTPRDEYMAWGIFQVLRGLAFLNNDAKLAHNSLFGDAVFVNQAGDWKLFGLDRVTPAGTIPSETPRHALLKYEPPESTGNQQLRTSEWSRDAWGAGCIIWEVFNGPLPAARNLGQLGSIPKKLVPVYKEMVASNPAKRPNAGDKVESLRRGGGFFKNELIDTLVFLEELHLKEDSDKSRFFSELGSRLDNFPTHVSCHRILPELIKACEFGNLGSAVIGSVLKLGRNLKSQDDYVRLVVPCVVKMFTSNDRNARFKLLSQVDLFAEHLNEKTVNEEIFSHIQTGFTDQEPMIREKTVISMIHLAPKLSFANLDEMVVMRHFARLLRDEQAGIRTNTAVCLGKIARHLHHATRQKVLIPAFIGKLRDPFPPARIAAMNALAATQQFFTIAETSQRVLPALCPALTDPEPPVRQQAFKVCRGFLDKLEEVSKNPELRQEMEAEVMSSSRAPGGAAASASAVASWANWAVGALGAKFYKSTPASPQRHQQPLKVNEDSMKTESAEKVAKDDFVEKKLEKEEEKLEKLTIKKDESSAHAGDGWEEDDADWGSLEEETKLTEEQNSQISSSWKRQPIKANIDDSWDSWDPVEGDTSKDDEKKLREEKRAARRAELAAKREARKGPMKLGAKKD